MIHTASLSLYDINIVIEFEGGQVGESIRAVVKNLSSVTEKSNGSQDAAPIIIKILSKIAISLPEGSTLLSPENDPLRVFSCSGKLYIVLDKSILELDLESGTAVGYFDEPIFRYARMVSHRFLLSGIIILLHTRGFYYLHASAVEWDNEGYVFVGKSGSGKSTNAIRLIEKGWNYLSDDSVFLYHNDREQVEVRAIPNEFKLNAELLRKISRQRLVDHSFSIPNFQHTFSVPKFNKRFIRIEAAYPEQFINRCVAKVLIHPVLVSEPVSRMVPLSKLEALCVLMRESRFLFIRHASTGQHLHVLKYLVYQCRSYRLLAGRDLLDHPDSLSDIVLNASLEENGHGY